MPTHDSQEPELILDDAPPTRKQLSYLRSLAQRTGLTFVFSRTRAQASEEIRRLKAVRSSGFTFAELEAENEARAVHGDAALVRPDEVAGYGAACSWRYRR
jgi:hypothetical protein